MRQNNAEQLRDEFMRAVEEFVFPDMIYYNGRDHKDWKMFGHGRRFDRTPNGLKGRVNDMEFDIVITTKTKPKQ